ncbi:MAG: bifunctional methylenetetrahydrofolate dehydrogenase/methenyltetrahydrofolate cyclohydrolase FolD [Verrucomicrobiae bacterium]|nr:bifunctional methylenetetrahydrofolate dehydrogenase/methenyltetrahydrofolate cyclohydrolase FolD [Verrucomicrobiae bacterium]
MSATLIDGKAIAEEIVSEVAVRVAAFKPLGKVPGLAVVLVGDRPDSALYVRKKIEMCERLGILSRKVELPVRTTQEELLRVVGELNLDPAIHGILVQSPLPPPIDEQAVIRAIDPRKDVDGFHPVNVGKFTIGDPTGLVPCTPAGVIELLLRSRVELPGRRAVVLGRSMIVGKPAALLLLAQNATVTICHSKTRDLAEITRQAEILVVGIGRPEFVRAGMVGEGAVVIDVGIHVLPDATRKSGKRTVGDVAFDEVSAKCGMITPVPGGVGPMTIALLMRNTVKAFAAAVGEGPGTGNP